MVGDMSERLMTIWEADHPAWKVVEYRPTYLSAPLVDQDPDGYVIEVLHLETLEVIRGIGLSVTDALAHADDLLHARTDIEYRQDGHGIDIVHP
jgi:hypothetical protein